MTRSIFLPPEEETTVLLNFPGTSKEPVTVDIFELEGLIFKASKLAEEMGTKWQVQAPSILKKALGVDISPTQAVLLYGALQLQIEDAKKKLYEQS